MNQTKCIFILGMHRSGTSAFAGMIKLLGAELGSDLMQPWADNPKGFFENNKIWQFNQAILEQCEATWEAPFFYGVDWHEKKGLKRFKPQIKALILEELVQSGGNLLAIKDPRLCILYPLWHEVMEELGITSVCVLPFRHPTEVARSLQKRNGFCLERGYQLWLNHIFTAELASRKTPRVFFRFDDLFINPGDIVQSISRNLDVSFPRSFESASMDIYAFLDLTLKHHQSCSLEKTSMHRLIGKLFESLCLVAKLGRSQEQSACFDRLRNQYESLFQFFLNADIELIVNAPARIANAQKQLEECTFFLHEREAILADLEASNNILNSQCRSLRQEIQAMRETVSWKAAERMRKLFKWRRGGR